MKRKFSNYLNKNILLFSGGLLGVAHETLIQHAERPTLLILFAAMMGLPAFLPQSGHSTDPHEKETEAITKVEVEVENETKNSHPPHLNKPTEEGKAR